ncbi:MAG: sulfatase-like hydrolase/transferase [Planctomycetales bacterium]|nr:sulfatase-like hydrolase/transferase [Planctomycetales bacterium]
MRWCLLAAGFGSLAVAETRGASPEHSRPNIVLIMADDLGVEGLGCYGGQSYRTPALDKLAREGMRFEHAYAQPLCTNTRLQLMTGLYNHRNWIAFGLLDPRAKTIGHWMQEAGYHTCIAGKWQLQSYDPPDYPGAAERRGRGMRVERAGFDEYSLWHTGHTEVKGSRYADPVIYENGRFREDLKGKFGPDVWVDFIKDYVTRHKDGSQPFFVYYPMALPHWPFVPTPRSRNWQDPKLRHAEDYGYFQDMVESMDECVGRIVDHIDALKLQRETLILFFSDNGTHLKVTTQTQSGPVQGGKGLTTDAGTHVPLIARWTGRIDAGLVCSELVDSTDFLPTVCDAAQRPVSVDAKLDGRSFLAALLGKPYEPRPWVFCHFDPRPGWDKDRFRLQRFARDRRHKLYDDGRLFDVAADPLEQSPLGASSEPGTRQRLQAVLEAMKSKE